MKFKMMPFLTGCCIGLPSFIIGDAIGLNLLQIIIVVICFCFVHASNVFWK